ncbi:MAG: methyltransferase [Myxococcaceae bacterium]|nr:methyltransferase [Myxococcaceae bacterium]
MALSGTQRRRLDERLEVLQGTLSEQQYLLHLQSPSGAAELSALISVVAVHKTDLFRDEVQLASFRAHVLEPLVGRALGRPLRLWSAGCATGEEVATLLMMLEEAGADPGSTVLGTDISEAALNRARTLSFPSDQVRRLPGALRERYFMPDGSRALLVPELRERAIFHHHNLMEAPYPTAGGGGEGFDVIFCRNVLIYFTPEAFNQVVEALAERLAPGGTLVLSSAEPLLHAPPSLRVIRGEHAFFYVRTPDLLAAQARRAPRSGSLPSELSSPAAERRRDAGAFPVVAPAAAPEWPREAGSAPPAAPEWPKEASSTSGPAQPSGSEPRRDSGRFASVPSEPRKDSGRFATVPSEPKRESGSFASVPGEPRRDSGRFATVAPEARRDSGRFSAVPPPPAHQGAAGSGHFPAVLDADLQTSYLLADSLFASILDGAGETDAQTEDYLRRCLSMDPELSAARYLLGMLLELREAFPEAASEYRRALRSLEEGRARSTPFFLNHSRLQVACARAIERLEGGGRPR